MVGAWYAGHDYPSLGQLSHTVHCACAHHTVAETSVTAKSQPGFTSHVRIVGAVLSQPSPALQERKSVANAGLTVKKLTGDDIKPEHWEAFYQGYINTTGAGGTIYSHTHTHMQHPQQCDRTN